MGHPDLAPGDLRQHDGRLLVGTGSDDAALELVELQPAGKRQMPAGEWLRGLREPLGRVTEPAARP